MYIVVTYILINYYCLRIKKYSKRKKILFLKFSCQAIWKK